MDPEAFNASVARHLNDGTPFLFVVDFDCRRLHVHPLETAAQEGFLYDIKGNTNAGGPPVDKPSGLSIIPVDEALYAGRFRNVQSHLRAGDTYLLNLTFPSELRTALSLADIFHLAQAPYKLLFRDAFTVFSPECFIRIHGDHVYTYPMKGTIDARVPDARAVLLNDRKEQWEHNTIVDLMRNDLSMIARDVAVTRYRYVERIRTTRNEILQTSSEIRGTLPAGWRDRFGHDLLRLLPAGSISGAPKQRTVEIIRNNEITPRGYYTGVFGIFDGHDLDSAVSIRFVESVGGRLYYKSGGGITADSVLADEYRELVQKIYIPVGQGD